MSVEIRYCDGAKPSDREIIAMLNSQYPDKIFSLGTGNTIVESYRDQPELPSSIPQRIAREAKLGFGATASIEDIERMMTSDFE